MGGEHVSGVDGGAAWVCLLEVSGIACPFVLTIAFTVTDTLPQRHWYKNTGRTEWEVEWREKWLFMFATFALFTFCSMSFCLICWIWHLLVLHISLWQHLCRCSIFHWRERCQSLWCCGSQWCQKTRSSWNSGLKNYKENRKGNAHMQVRGIRSAGSSSQLTIATDGKPAGSMATTPHTNTHTRTGRCAGTQVQELRWKWEQVRIKGQWQGLAHRSERASALNSMREAGRNWAQKWLERDNERQQKKVTEAALGLKDGDVTSY